jgi:glucokinase
VVSIGIDIGGTRLKVGRVQDGHVVQRTSAPTPHDFQKLVGSLAQLVTEVADGITGLPVAAGVPGVFDEGCSMVVSSPNLRFLDGLPLRDSLSEAIGAPVRLGNDASVAALAEKLHGKGTDFPNFLLATLGTGIGGGLILENQLWQGAAGMAGEFGHVSAASAFEADNIWMCGCGTPGCLETFASASRMEQRGKQRCGVDDLPQLAQMARDGHEGALSVFHDAGTALGEGFAQVVLLLDIRVLLIGGGASPVLDLLREPLLDRVTFRCAGLERRKFHIEAAQLGNDAGLLGAAALAKVSLS